MSFQVEMTKVIAVKKGHGLMIHPTKVESLLLFSPQHAAP